MFILLEILAAIMPVFILIFCGWFVRKRRWVGEHCTSELNRFVLCLALPALLSDIIINSSWDLGLHWDFVGAYAVATLLLFIATYLQRVRTGEPKQDAVIDSLNTSYANTGFMGFPLLLGVVGEESRQLVLIATLFTVCVLFALAMVVLESGHQQTSRRHQHVYILIIKNPIVAASVCASIVAASNIHLYAPINTSLHLLGAAATPCALITIGMFLADRTINVEETSWNNLQLVVMKLVIHPLIVFVLAFCLFELPPVSLLCAVTLAALPTGTGPFMLAESYNRNPSSTSQSILFSTALSPLTLLIILSFLAQ